MKRTKTRNSSDIFADTVAAILWLIYKFITVVLPICIMIWLALSMVEVVVNLDHFVSGIPYEYHKFNFFFVIKNLLNR